jgi:hypothetical protein
MVFLLISTSKVLALRHAAYDKRTPGLFKTEFTGDGMIALCSKTYYCFGKEDKFSCKGINKRTNQITKEKYMLRKINLKENQRGILTSI